MTRHSMNSKTQKQNPIQKSIEREGTNGDGDINGLFLHVGQHVGTLDDDFFGGDGWWRRRFPVIGIGPRRQSSGNVLLSVLVHLFCSLSLYELRMLFLAFGKVIVAASRYIMCGFFVKETREGVSNFVSSASQREDQGVLKSIFIGDI